MGCKSSNNFPIGKANGHLLLCPPKKVGRPAAICPDARSQNLNYDVIYLYYDVIYINFDVIYINYDVLLILSPSTTVNFSGGRHK